ncbi:MAG: RDD family protein [Deltaproteobacteria bacterium]|nr:RDD family protein [Deltaproteobacteria bacterium]
MTRRMYSLTTPEGLELELELAPMGARLAAFSLDFLLMAAGTALLVALAAAGGMLASAPVLALVILFSFLLWNGYFLFFELYWRGATPGKRVLGIRVISRHGGPLTTGAVFARNLLRDLELYLPLQVLIVPDLIWGKAPGWVQLLASGWIFVFLLMPFLNRDRARCGDLVAGTLVVQRPEAQLLPDAAETRLPKDADFEFSAAQLDMYGIRELQVLEEILHRDVSEPGRFDLLMTVCYKITRKIAWPQPVPPERVVAFLQAFYRAQRARLEQRLLFGERREFKKIGRLSGPRGGPTSNP